MAAVVAAVVRDRLDCEANFVSILLEVEVEARSDTENCDSSGRCKCGLYHVAGLPRTVAEVPPRQSEFLPCDETGPHGGIVCPHVIPVSRLATHYRRIASTLVLFEKGSICFARNGVAASHGAEEA